MEVPPGRVERIADGGAAAIRSILEELRAMKFNGLLKTSVFRGDVPSEGVLVLRDGDGVLAEHRSSVDLAGRPAVPEILKDATSSRAQLEVRTYDYGHSSISIEQLQRSYPDASVDGIGDADALLTRVAAEAVAEHEASARGLEVRRDQEKSLIEREEELYRRKWELEKESQRSGLRQRELDALRSELAAVKEASALIMQRLEARNASESVEVESQKKLLAMESSRGRVSRIGSHGPHPSNGSSRSERPPCTIGRLHSIHATVPSIANGNRRTSSTAASRRRPGRSRRPARCSTRAWRRRSNGSGS